MKDKLFYSKLLADSRKLHVAVVSLAAIMSFTGCSQKSESNEQASSVTANNVTLTAEQRQKIKSYTVALE